MDFQLGWGSADLLNAFYQANHAAVLAGRKFGAMYFIPTVVVPLLLITHGVAFYLLLAVLSPSTVRALAGDAATS